jgi:hypothetical protein
MAGEEPHRDPPWRIAPAERPPEWRWWNPFTWFSWGIDWSEAVDQELAIVRQLNLIFGTAHTRLDQFTAEERARIEQALGQKFNWEEASAIRVSERELQIRDKVLLGSQVSLGGSRRDRRHRRWCSVDRGNRIRWHTPTRDNRLEDKSPQGD